jgi:hypothetical protein
MTTKLLAVLALVLLCTPARAEATWSDSWTTYKPPLALHFVKFQNDSEAATFRLIQDGKILAEVTPKFSTLGTIDNPVDEVHVQRLYVSQSMQMRMDQLQVGSVLRVQGNELYYRDRPLSLLLQEARSANLVGIMISALLLLALLVVVLRSYWAEREQYAAYKEEQAERRGPMPDTAYRGENSKKS